MDTRTRVYVPMETEDLTLAERLHDPDSVEAQVLAEVTGIEIRPDSSKAATFNALIAAGRKAVEEKALEIGYARASEFDRADPERQAWITAMRRRRRTRWATPGQEATK